MFGSFLMFGSVVNTIITLTSMAIVNQVIDLKQILTSVVCSHSLIAVSHV